MAQYSVSFMSTDGGIVDRRGNLLPVEGVIGMVEGALRASTTGQNSGCRRWLTHKTKQLIALQSIGEIRIGTASMVRRQPA